MPPDLCRALNLLCCPFSRGRAAVPCADGSPTSPTRAASLPASPFPKPQRSPASGKAPRRTSRLLRPLRAASGSAAGLPTLTPAGPGGSPPLLAAGMSLPFGPCGQELAAASPHAVLREPKRRQYGRGRTGSPRGGLGRPAGALKLWRPAPAGPPEPPPTPVWLRCGCRAPLPGLTNPALKALGRGLAAPRGRSASSALGLLLRGYHTPLA